MKLLFHFTGLSRGNKKASPIGSKSVSSVRRPRKIVPLQSAAHPPEHKLSRQPGHFKGTRSVKEIVEGGDVALGHLQGLVFGELLLAAEAGQHGAQLVERVVQAEHAAPFARVRRQPALLHHHWVRAAPPLLRVSLFSHALFTGAVGIWRQNNSNLIKFLFCILLFLFYFLRIFWGPQRNNLMNDIKFIKLEKNEEFNRSSLESLLRIQNVL